MTRRTRKPTEQEKSEIVRAWPAMRSAERLASLFGRSVPTVKAILEEAGVVHQKTKAEAQATLRAQIRGHREEVFAKLKEK